MKELLKNQEEMYRLVEQDDGRLVLEVICGGIALYWVRIPLDDDERQRYGDEGATFIAEMASDVAHDPDRFKERSLPDPPTV